MIGLTLTIAGPGFVATTVPPGARNDPKGKTAKPAAEGDKRR